jgi:hypothetical protein
VESYKLLIKASAAKELEAVGRKSNRTRIVDKIYTLKDDPALKGAKSSRVRIVIGSARASSGFSTLWTTTNELSPW